LSQIIQPLLAIDCRLQFIKHNRNNPNILPRLLNWTNVTALSIAKRTTVN